MKKEAKNKKNIRSSIILLRNNLDRERRKKFDNIILKKIVESSDYKNADCIFIFVSYKSEVDTHKIIKIALENGKRVCVPKVISRNSGMDAVEIKDFNDLISGKFGILEPMNTELKIDESYIDVTYIPGVAFDDDGRRLGYGGGYYDRFLGRLRGDCKKIGICYDFQIIDKVPVEKHDILMDEVVSN